MCFFNYFNVQQNTTLIKNVRKKNEKWIYDHFRFTCCSDEHFLQTMILGSKFEKRLHVQGKYVNYTPNMRWVEWIDETPVILKMDRFHDLIKSPYIFARKFSMRVDSQIVEEIYSCISSKNEEHSAC